MLKNFLLVAIRNISRNKSFTFINLAGLSIGIASAVFILLFIISELSYDRMYEHSDRVYRLYQEGKMSNSEFRVALTSPPAGPALAEEIPEITDYVRIVRRGQILITVEDKKYLEEQMVFADSGLFNLFNIPVLFGDPDEMLKEPNSLVITESISRKYFGDDNPVGRLVETDTDTSLFRITGVITDLPDETHLGFNIIVSFSTNAESRSNYWLSSYLNTYVLLDDKRSADRVQEHIHRIVRTRLTPQIKQVLGMDIDEFEASGNKFAIFLQPLRHIHLDPAISGGFKPSSDRKYLKIFGFIAIFIILIGSINFMNLSTAKASGRAKEVGMRKITGSGRGMIIKQFLWESVFLSMLSLVFALIIVEIILPFFNNMMDLNLKLQYLSKWYTLPGLLLLSVIVGLISGIYPAVSLSSYSPVDALKSRYQSITGGTLVRNILVVVQFTVSIVIITGTIVIYAQLRYIKNRDLGFLKENIQVLYRLDPIKNRIPAFLSEIEQHPAIVKASNSSIYPGNSNNRSSYQVIEGDTLTSFLFHTYWTDQYFPETYDIKLKAGRFFSNSITEDSSAVVINEAALRKFNLKDTFNTVLIQPRDDGVGRELKIIGVVEDFHTASLHSEVSPLLIQRKNESQYSGFISVRIKEGEDNVQTALRHIQRTWSQFTNDEPLQHFSLESRLDNYYREEQRSGKLSLIFSFLAIFLACLGLYGLTMYTTQRRIKEISIRKVHGASVSRIMLMIVANISVLLVISTVIAWLISWKTSVTWLNDFTYRIELHPLIFITGAAFAIVIALITVGAQAYVAAQTHPARFLRYE